jgi:carbon-monoxide dehydrogenase large subunit
LPPIVNPVQAAAPDAIQIRDDKAGQVGNKVFDWEIGDKARTDKAFADADVVSKIELHYPRTHPSPMETCGSLADYDRATGKLTVYMTSQAPHIVRAAVAMVAELPEQNIRIVTPDIGGGFGNKVPIYPGYVIAILASILTEKPVKWIEDKTGNLTSTGFGRDVYLKGEMAMRKDGKILGVRMNTISDHGAFFADAQPSKFKIGLMHSAFAAYDIPTAHMFATGYYTNKAPGGVAYRCSFRVTEAMFFQERMVQAAADDLGMDQAEFRRINFVKDEQHPHRTAFGFLTDSGQYEKCLDIGLEAIGYKNFAAEKAEAAKRGRLLGIGISTMTEPLGAGNSREYDILGIKMFDSAELRIHMSGKALLRTGSRGQGTGHETTWAQIVAHELGIPADDILVEEGDTDTAPFGMGTYASRSTPVAGAAIAMVARKVRAKARKLAAHLLEVSEEDIEWELGRFYVRGNQERGVTIQECAMAAYSNMPDGMEPGLENVAYYDPPNLTWPFACYIAKVEIDPETGVWDVLQFVAVDDCGVRINPMIVEGQIMGGLTEAYAMANMQYQTYDEEGNIIGGNYMDFLLPTAWETPGFELYEVVTPCPHHPIGAKGVGECATVGGPAAFVNAVMDALKDKGVRNIDMPLMPNRVYEALTTGKDVYGMPPVRSGN